MRDQLLMGVNKIAKKRFFFVAIILIAIVVVYVSENISNRKRENISFWLHSPPHSIDPIEYDYFVHHAAFRSVFSSLVSQYAAGGYKGVIAESWAVSDEYKTWQFKLRTDLRFENGDIISPQHVLSSLKRIAYLQNKKKSNSILFKKIVGFEKFHNIDDTIEGLRVEGSVLIIKFSKPFKNLLEVLSFGLYAIVHPSNYNPKDGLWIDHKSAISSAAYRLEFWKEYSLRLQLREDFGYDEHHKNRFTSVDINWNPSAKYKGDIALQPSFSTEFGNLGFKFVGPIPSSIMYLRCDSWNQKGSVCSSRANRITLRENFYSEFTKLGGRVVRSFFPLAMSGISEINELTDFKSQEIKVKRKLVFKYSKDNIDLFITSLRNVAMNESLEFKHEKIALKNAYYFLENDINTDFDIFLYSTGILLDDPNHDIEFMFLTKEGVILPDEDGSITSDLRKGIVNPQKINQIIFEQAIIWPVFHYSNGIWIKDDIDISMLDIVQPPIDFNWVGAL